MNECYRNLRITISAVQNPERDNSNTIGKPLAAEKSPYNQLINTLLVRGTNTGLTERVSGNDGFTVCREPSANANKGEVLLSRGMPRPAQLGVCYPFTS